DGGVALLQLGGGAVRVGLAALAHLGVVGGDPGDLGGIGADLEGDGPPALGAQQLQVPGRHPEQDVVADGGAGELALSHHRAGYEAAEDGRRDVAVPDDARNGDRAGPDGVGAEPEVEGAAVDLDDDAGGALQRAGVVVVVRPDVDGGQELGGGQLPLG